jgi:hypothetical protein
MNDVLHAGSDAFLALNVRSIHHPPPISGMRIGWSPKNAHTATPSTRTDQPPDEHDAYTYASQM